MVLRIIEDDLNGEEIRELLQTHFNLMRSQSPAESCHVLPIDELKKPEIKFWSMWNEGEIIGCGALKVFADNQGEVKSMHIYKKFRGNGYSKLILNYIINYAKQNLIANLYLETGAQQEFKAAQFLYENSGFIECPPFGDYKIDPLSKFYKLAISTNL